MSARSRVPGSSLNELLKMRSLGAWFAELPTLHQPSYRRLRASLGGWQLREFPHRAHSGDQSIEQPAELAYGETLKRYLLPRGMWHVQLWHPAGVSIITPSKLTLGAFEVACVSVAPRRFVTYSEAAAHIAAIGLTPPSSASIAWVLRCFVQGPIRLLRERRSTAHRQLPAS